MEGIGENFDIGGEKGNIRCSFCNRWARTHGGKIPLKLAWVEGRTRRGYICRRCCDIVMVLIRRSMENKFFKRMFKDINAQDRMKASLSGILYGRDLNSEFRSFLFSQEIIEELKAVLFKDYMKTGLTINKISKIERTDEAIVERVVKEHADDKKLRGKLYSDYLEKRKLFERNR